MYIATFITFTTYGTWLHGDERGSVIVNDGRPKYFKNCSALENKQRKNLKENIVKLNQADRKVVLNSIIEVCQHKHWQLFAAHVRSNHVHILVNGEERPEKMMTVFKGYATRALRESGFSAAKVWTRHGSTIYIKEQRKLKKTARYIAYEQGKPMEYYIMDGF